MKPSKAYRGKCRGMATALLMCLALAVGMTIGASATETTAETTAETHTAVPYNQAGQSNPSTDTLRPNHQPVSYGLCVLAAQDEVVFSGLCGNEITFTADDIRRAMNISELNYITVTGLPEPGEGTLFAGAVGATEGQVISAGSLSYLSFAAADDTKPCEATMTISVNGSGYDITCRLRLAEALNYTPTVSLAPAVALFVETYTDLPSVGTLSAYDPEGDEVTFEIVRYAEHGRVTLTDKHTGAYTYTPDSGFKGEDAFTYVVRDMYGNYSTAATVNINVTARPTSVAYADIDGQEGADSILRVSLSGIMNGTKVGAETYFKPTETMNRVEFLVTAMHAAGVSAEETVDLNDPSFADCEAIPASMRGYVSLAVQRGYVSGKTVDGELCFCPDEAITRAEAAVILSNIIGYAHKTTVTAFADAEEMPAWSVQAMVSLKALGILSPTDGNADARSLITRADTAVWLDRTVRVMRGA